MLKVTPEILRIRSSKTLVEEWKRILADPTTVKALEALDSLCRMRVIPGFSPGTPHDTTIAHEACERAGANSFMVHLRSMAYGIEEKSPFDEAMEMEAEYEHAIDEALRSKN